MLKSITKLSGTKFLSLFQLNYENSKYFVASRNENYDGTASPVAAVTIFAVNKAKDKMLLTKEYRFPVNDWTTSTPAGIIDDNDTPEETALRELAEETGYTKATVVKVLPATYSSVGMTDERVQPVIVEVDETVSEKPRLQDEENIKHYWVTKEEAKHIALTETNLTARCQLALLLFAEGKLL